MHSIDKPPIPNHELSLGQEITGLINNPAIRSTNLASRRMTLDEKDPQKPAAAVPLDTPIVTSINNGTKVEQDLMAILSLGKDVAIGVIKSMDANKNSTYYVSLFNDDRLRNDGRAWLLESLDEGNPVQIGREKIEKTVGSDGVAPGVSGNHCTIRLVEGQLVIVDQESLNGTTILTNQTSERLTSDLMPISIWEWSVPTSKIKEILGKDIIRKAKTTTIAHLGEYGIK